MSGSRLVWLAGGAIAVVLSALLVWGAAAGRWTVVALALAAFLSLLLLVQLDTWRRTRSMRNYLRDEIRRSAASGGGGGPEWQPYTPRVAERPAATQDDLLGAVRVMQAQYTGRLDHLQSTLDRALADLPTTSSQEEQR